MSERVIILGDGAMATVCSILLDHNGHDVTMWGAFPDAIERLRANREQTKLLPGVRVPDAVRLTADDADALRDAEIAVLAIPTQYLRSVCMRLKPHVPTRLPIVSVAKGIEIETSLTPSQVIGEVLGKSNPLCVLSGPNIAGEIARRLPASAVAASSDPALAQRVQQLFSTGWFRVYTNPDALGVEIAAATKNVIALAAGMLDGLGAGSNAKAALVTRGLVEIARLGVALGGRAETFSGLAGLGDLVTTCISAEGRNRSVGERLGRGERIADILASMSSVAEGVPTTKAVVALAHRRGIAMPIAEQVHRVLFEGKDASAALADLMSRDLKPERTD
jgi:glycerol-3-phosphate dehydrogenase (NAD(P)+)